MKRFPSASRSIHRGRSAAGAARIRNRRKGGGIGPTRKVAAVAEAAGLTCTVGSNLEMGVASAAMIHLALATPGIGVEEFPCDILSSFFSEADLLAERLPITGGSAKPHEKPGLGVELDPDKVAHYRVR